MARDASGARSAQAEGVRRKRQRRPNFCGPTPFSGTRPSGNVPAEVTATAQMSAKYQIIRYIQKDAGCEINGSVRFDIPPIMKRSLPPNHSALLAFLCGAALPLLAASTASSQNAGMQDPAFAAGADANFSVHALALQSDGQALVGGNFTTFNGSSRNAIARVHPDGSLDAFNPGLVLSGYPNGTPNIQALAVLPDGRILAAGTFSVLNQPVGGGIVRLFPDGTLDPSFNAGTGAGDAGDHVGVVYALQGLPNGQFLVGGDFRSFNGAAVQGLVRLNADGSLDATFNTGGAGITGNSYGRDVRGIAIDSAGKIFIGGHFNAYDGQTANCVVRLNADGTLNSVFDGGQGPGDGGVLALDVQMDGKVLLGGGFNTFDGVTVPHLVRLNANGTLDTGYTPGGNLFISEVDSILIQAQGAALIGGAFLSQGGLVNSPHNGVARLLPSGVQDATFDSGPASRQAVALALQPDGKVVVASNLYVLTGVATGNVSRLFDVTTFFSGEAPVGNGVYYLAFANSNPFGYYSFLFDPHYIYHFDLGFEYVFDAMDGQHGVYLYDFTSNTFFYTSPTFPFPYLYDFTLNSVVYYYPDPNNSGRYNTNGVRYFYVFNTSSIISK